MYIYACKRVHPHPRHPGDIGDIGDILRKPLKLPDFLKAPGGDILGDIFGDGDKSPSCDAAEVFPKRKRFVNPNPSSKA